MFGDNIDPQYIHMDMDSRNIAPPPKKTQHIHIDIDRGNIDLQHMYINRGTIIPPLHMVMNIDNMHMHIDMDRGDMNSGNISVPQTHTHGHDQRQH
jgi:hypothetical protein